MILRIHRAAGKGQLRVTYEKFAGWPGQPRPGFSWVAMIRALDKLPALYQFTQNNKPKLRKEARQDLKIT